MESRKVVDKSGGTSDVTVSSSSYGLISALFSKLRVTGSKHFTVAGDHHPMVNLNSCSYVNVEGKGCNVQMDSTTYTNVTGGSSEIINADADNSSVKITSSTRGAVRAVNSFMDVSKSSYFKVDGERHRQVMLKSCSNIKINGTEGDLNLDSTSYTKINGHRNTVKAEDASYLVVQGDGNNVEVKDVSYHNFQPSVSKDTNVYEVVGGNGGSNPGIIGLLSYVLGKEQLEVSNGKKFHVDYVEKAKITGSRYNLGTYRFDVKSYPSYVDVRIDPSAVTDLKVKSTEGGKALELEGRGGNGTVEKLVLKGLSVQQTEDNVFRINVNDDARL